MPIARFPNPNPACACLTLSAVDFRQQREKKGGPRNTGPRDCFCYQYGIFIIVVMRWYISPSAFTGANLTPPVCCASSSQGSNYNFTASSNHQDAGLYESYFAGAQGVTTLHEGPSPRFRHFYVPGWPPPAQQKKRRIGQAQIYCFNPSVLSPMFVWDGQLCTMPRKDWTKTQGKMLL